MEKELQQILGNLMAEGINDSAKEHALRVAGLTTPSALSLHRMGATINTADLAEEMGFTLPLTLGDSEKHVHVLTVAVTSQLSDENNRIIGDMLEHTLSMINKLVKDSGVIEGATSFEKGDH